MRIKPFISTGNLSATCVKRLWVLLHRHRGLKYVYMFVLLQKMGSVIGVAAKAEKAKTVAACIVGDVQVSELSCP